MAEKLNHGVIARALDYAYDKAIKGLPGLETAEELAQSYHLGDDPIAEKVNSLIRWQIAKASAAGFISNVGGLMTLPVAIPANLASVLYVQLRMVAAIAVMGGHDVREDRVKTLCFLCLCGSAAADTVKTVGINIGTKLTTAAVGKISGATITKINQAVGFRLLTKFGQTGAINLGKGIPLIGGVIGGCVDGVMTNMIGNVARTVFITEP